MKRAARAGALVMLTAACVFAPAAAAQETAGYPVADGYVVDAAGSLSAGTEAALEDELRAYEARTTNQIGVAVVPTLGGHTIEEYATGLFAAWGVGQASSNNGVLLVVATGDRKLRIEVGTGLTDEFPDAQAASVVEREIVPRLRAGDIDGGVRAGTIGIRRALGDDVATPDSGGLQAVPAVAPPGDSVAVDEVPLGDYAYPSDPGVDPSLLLLLLPLGLIGFGVTRLFSGGDSCPNCGRALSWGGAARRGAFDSCGTCDFSRHRLGGPMAGVGFGRGLLAMGSSGGSSSGSGGSSGGGGSSSSGGGSSFGGGSSSGGGASGSW